MTLTGFMCNLSQLGVTVLERGLKENMLLKGWLVKSNQSIVSFVTLLFGYKVLLIASYVRNSSGTLKKRKFKKKHNLSNALHSL